MIYFLSTASHAYTHQVIEDAIPAVKRLSYIRAMARRELPRATYIFSDLDRLSVWQLELAARLYRTLQGGGCRVINDPARVLHRLALLQRLERLGLNAFKAWPATDADLVDRYPVFIRTQTAHRGVLSEPLQTPAELAAALEGAIEKGFPVSDLMVIEYCAEPLPQGIFRKHSMYRMGDQMIGSSSVHDEGWVAKEGQMGIATQALYDEEYRDIVERPHSDAIRKVFDIANVEYGRADFGFVGGRIQIYEINTNPSMKVPGEHPFPVRVQSYNATWAGVTQACRALDTVEAGPPVPIERPAELLTQQRRFHLFPGYQWQP